jgi:3-hydroxyisobutyrate dehydrogenase-like beta-hydroxyacid dehydrogenase
MSGPLRICLIGFGEVGQILADDLARANGELSAWDIKFVDAVSAPAQAIARRSIRAGKDAADAMRGADFVISAVTAAQTKAAAYVAAQAIKSGTFYLDLNSASPAAKRDAGRAIDGAGAHYVEAAVMSPIQPKRIATAMLLGGPHAERFLPIAQDLGFSGARLFSAELGRASAAKMCRSIMVKGIEALLCEALLTARHYGVEGDVLASLKDLFPGPDWPKLSRYMISRAIEHGVRRAEEMREAAETVREAGLEPLMSAACAERQDWAAQFKATLGAEELQPMLDALRASLSRDQAR